MAVMVEITFVGLFTFVQRGDVTHVLLPSTAGHEHHGMPRHEARLYLGPTSLAGGPLPVPWSVPLDRTILRITDRNRAPNAPPLPELLFDLSSVTEQPVAAEVLGEAPSAARVHARIDLDMHGTPEGIEPVGKFFLKNDPQDPTEAGQPILMASYTGWAESVKDGDLQVTLSYLDGDGASRVVDLTPARFPSGTGTLALTVYHVIPDELPPNVPSAAVDGQRVDHWDATYELFDTPARRPMPVFDEQEPSKGIVPNTCGGTKARS